MPQLDLYPWFAILFACWFIFLLIAAPQVMAFTLGGTHEGQAIDSHALDYWHWPWL
nr:ATP synthase F0 subunit 8 [Tigrigobius macrodon]